METFGWGPYEDKDNSLTPSGIVQLAKSAKHFYSSYILKETEKTPLMIEGSLIHKYILEKERFEQEHVLYPEDSFFQGCLKTADDLKKYCDSNGLKKSGTKDELAKRVLEHNPATRIYDVEFNKLAGNKELLEKKISKKALRIEKEIKAHKFADKLIYGEGEEESLGYYTDERTGVVIRFKLDKKRKLKSKLLVADLKITSKISKKQFEANIYQEKLHIQAALYVDAMKSILGEDALFCWVAVQSTPPFTVQTYVADFGCIEAGRVEAYHAIELWKECKKNNVWQDKQELVNVSLPHWAWSELEEA